MIQADDPGAEAPDFFAVDGALQAAGADFRAADAHGLLCGLACARQAVSEEDWLREVLRPSESCELPETRCCGLLSRLYEHTIAQLASEEYVFSIFSPADEHPLCRRAEALKSWCQGFLYGLVLGGAGNGSSLAPQAREIVTDFAEITRLDEKAVDSEVNEVAYAELVEFVRVAVVLLREELGGSHRSGEAAVMLDDQ